LFYSLFASLKFKCLCDHDLIVVPQNADYKIRKKYPAGKFFRPKLVVGRVGMEKRDPSGLLSGIN
jgi:hypothetical protein